jgi:hypothetical protein
MKPPLTAGVLDSGYRFRGYMLKLRITITPGLTAGITEIYSFISVYRKYKYYVLIFFVSIMFQFFKVENFAQDSKGITITLSMDTNVFYEMQQVWLSVKFKNEGTKPDSIPELHEYGVHCNLSLINNNGVKLERKLLFSTAPRINYTKLEPGEEKIIDTPIRDVFGDVENGEKLRLYSPYNLFSIGVYRISIVFPVNSKTGRKLISNTLVYEVVKAEGYEENCLDILKDIYKLSDRTQEGITFITNGYSKFIEEHKLSVYYHEVFSNLVRMRIFTKKVGLDSAILGIEKYLENNPMSYESKGIAWYYAEACIKFIGKHEAGNKLSELKLRFPDTRLSEGIDNTLKSHLFN